MSSSRMRSQLRKDYLQDSYVIVAPRRRTKPHDTSVALPAGAAEENGSCKLCPEYIDKEKEIARRGPAGAWRIKVVPNAYPVLTPQNADLYCVQELIIETPDKRQLEELPERQIAELLDVYAERTRALMRDKRVEYLIIFKNEGGRAGASMRHAHSQIYGMAFVPPHHVDKSAKAHEYRERTGRCAYCDVIRQELKGPRLVYEDRYVVAFTPYASRYRYELWILPKRHIDNITELTATERRRWAHVLKRSLQAIDDLGLSYNYYFHQVVRDTDQHLYMKLTPRADVWAGLELGSGLIVNPMPPETAAKHYRKWLN